MGQTLFDRAGNPVDVPDEQVTPKLLSGELGTVKPTVTVRTPTGKVFDVPTANLNHFAASEPGIKVLSDAQIAEHDAATAAAEKEKKYGGLGWHAATAAHSFVSGLTLGASDALLGGVLGGQTKKDLEESDQVNSGTSTIAGIAGALAPVLLTDGAAAPEEASLLGVKGLTSVGEEASALSRIGGAAKSAVLAPQRALEFISGGTERGIASLLGSEGKTVVGSAIKRGLARAGGDAVAGALVTGAQDLGENSLSTDHQLTGEQILQHMGMGALLGGGVGTIASALDRPGATALDKLALQGGEAERGADGIRGILRKHAEEMQFEATGARTPEIKRLAAEGHKTNDVGGWALDNLSRYTEDGGAPITREAIGEAAQKAVAEAGDHIGQSIDALDKFGVPLKIEPIVEKLRSEVVEPLAKKIGQNAAATKLAGAAEQVAQRLEANPTFAELQKVRIELDELGKKGRKVMDESNVTKEMRNASSILEGALTEQGTAVAGDTWKQTYVAAKHQYDMGKAIVDTVDSAGHRIAGNNRASLTEKLIGAHGIVSLAGGAAAMAAGEASGHSAEGEVLGTIGALAAHRILHRYGEGLASRLLNRLAGAEVTLPKLQALSGARVVQAAQQRYSTAVTRGLSALTSSGARAYVANRGNSDNEFQRNAKMVKNALSDPQSHVANIQSQASGLGPNFQTVGSSYQKAALSVTTYLAQQMPKERPVDPAMPKGPKIEPTPSEKQTFNAVVKAVTDPTSLLHSAARGDLTPDQITAAQTTHPASFKDLQLHLVKEMASLKKPLDPSAQAGVNMILGKSALPPAFNIAPQKNQGAPQKVTRPMRGKLSAQMSLPDQSTAET